MRTHFNCPDCGVQFRVGDCCKSCHGVGTLAATREPMSREQADQFLDDYMIDPVPDGAAQRLVDTDWTKYPRARQSVHDVSIIVLGHYVLQDVFDAIIQGDSTR